MVQERLERCGRYLRGCRGRSHRQHDGDADCVGRHRAHDLNFSEIRSRGKSRWISSHQHCGAIARRDASARCKRNEPVASGLSGRDHVIVQEILAGCADRHRQRRGSGLRGAFRGHEIQRLGIRTQQRDATDGHRHQHSRGRRTASLRHYLKRGFIGARAKQRRTICVCGHHDWRCRSGNQVYLPNRANRKPGRRTRRVDRHRAGTAGGDMNNLVCRAAARHVREDQLILI